MFKKLAQQLNLNNKKELHSNSTCPFVDEFLFPKNEFLKNISKKAVKLYERKNDIKNFSQLVLSDFENTSHNEMVENLFKEGVADPFVDDKLEALAQNQKLLRDLGLM